MYSVVYTCAGVQTCQLGACKFKGILTAIWDLEIRQHSIARCEGIASVFQYSL